MTRQVKTRHDRYGKFPSRYRRRRRRVDLDLREALHDLTG